MTFEPGSGAQVPIGLMGRPFEQYDWAEDVGWQ